MSPGPSLNPGARDRTGLDQRLQILSTSLRPHLHQEVAASRRWGPQRGGPCHAAWHRAPSPRMVSLVYFAESQPWGHAASRGRGRPCGGQASTGVAEATWTSPARKLGPPQWGLEVGESGIHSGGQPGTRVGSLGGFPQNSLSLALPGLLLLLGSTRRDLAEGAAKGGGQWGRPAHSC